MKRLVITLLVISLLLSAVGALAEGLLPSLNDVRGVAMPSLGDVLHCYPDKEESTSDNETIEIYENVEENDFHDFSQYLNEIRATLVEYNLEGTVFHATISYNDKNMNFMYNFESKEARVTYPAGTYDKRMENARSRLQIIKDNIVSGKTEEAMNELSRIQDVFEYGPLIALLNETGKEDLLVEIHNRLFAVGNIILLGSYEQDNNTENGKEPIEWVVLKNEGKRVLLLSKYALDAQPWNTDGSKTNWESCTLRTWLNTTFIENAFTSREEMDIILTDVDYGGREDNEEGSSVKDKVSLLSWRDTFYEYFDNKEERTANCSQYVKDSGIRLSADNKCSWWLLNSTVTDEAPVCSSDGGTWYIDVDHECAVRPIIWLDIETGIYSLKQIIGIGMPSIGDILYRFPDGVTTDLSGNTIEVYQNVEEEDVDSYKTILLEKGAVVEVISKEEDVSELRIGFKRVSIGFVYNAKTKEAQMIYPHGTFDERFENSKAHYKSIQSLVSSGEKDEVIGSIFIFGNYEQDADESNGKEPIEWIILDINGSNVLLLSKYGLDAKRYNEQWPVKSISWEKCSLRKWLNDPFMNNAFNKQEQAAILQTNVDNSKSQGYSSDQNKGGKNTKDRVFLLSHKEASDYFSSNEARLMLKTKYAVESQNKAAELYDDTPDRSSYDYPGTWLLRSISDDFDNCSSHYVWEKGSLSSSGIAVCWHEYIRPALWLNLEADVFKVYSSSED